MIFLIRKSIFFKTAFLLLILLNVADNTCAEQKYNPSPIIFVHGYNTVRAQKYNLWQPTFKEFQKYFFDSNKNEFKYDNNRWYNYEALFDSRTISNGDLDTMANKLGSFINDVIDRLPSDQDKKVVIVAHSAGGIITRRLLYEKSSYQDKIDKVIFLDCPQLGSPLASGIILIDRMIPELKKLRDKYSYFSVPRFSIQNYWENLAYCNLYEQIDKTLAFYNLVVDYNLGLNIKDMLDGYKNPYRDPNDPNPGRYRPDIPHYEGQSVAVGQLAVPETISASKTFIGTSYSSISDRIMVATAPEVAKSSYEKNKTFLNNRPLGTPANFRTIRGQGSKAWFIGSTASSALNWVADFEGFPPGNSLLNLDTGDGVVTALSQTALAANQSEPNNTIYSINAFHTDAPAAWQTILEAIDDPPVIESVRFGASYWSHFPYDYVIFKLKDYLLADIEILEMKEGANSINLDDFKVPGTDNIYKPYAKYGKDFLKEHDYIEYQTDYEGRRWQFTFHLMPGEFVVKINRIGTSNGNPKIYLKVKNPTGKTATCAAYLLSTGSKIIQKEGHANGASSAEPPTPSTWQQTKDEAYSNFLNSTPTAETYFSAYLGIEYPVVWPYEIGSSSSVYYGQEYPGGPTYTGWSAYEKRWYKHWINFRLDLNEVEIAKLKSVKFIGELTKFFPDGASDFDIFVYRLSSNIWPPPLGLDDDGDQFLFKRNTAIVENREYKKIEEEINPFLYINLTGNNVWEFKTNIPDANHIPNPGGSYSLEGRIDFPVLFVTFEEDTPP